MSIEVKELDGIEFPSTGGEAITLLPTGFEKSLSSTEFHSNTISFAKFAREKLDLRYLSEPETLLEQRSSDWFGPIMLFSDQLLTEHPVIVSVVSGIISNYLYALFKGGPKPQAHLSVVCEKKGRSGHVRIDYKGDVEGLAELPEIVRKVHESDKP